MVHSSLVMLGREAPSQPLGQQVKPRYMEDPSGPREPFCFPFLVQHPIHFMRHSTLYYKLGSVLEDSAHLLFTVSALSTCRMSWAEL